MYSTVLACPAAPQPDALTLSDVAGDIRQELADAIEPALLTLRDCPATGTAADALAAELVATLARATDLAKLLAMAV